jgi:hypothetical protein
MTVGIAKYTKQHSFPFAGEIPHGCKCLCQYTLTETLFLDRGEKFGGERSLNLRLKRTKYNMLQKFLPVSDVSFFLLPQNIL